MEQHPVITALLLVAAVVAAVSTILGALWWLLRPRVDRYLGTLVAQSERATQGCVDRLETVADRLDEHDERLAALEATRSFRDLDELVDLVDLVLRHRPSSPNWPPPARYEGNNPT